MFETLREQQLVLARHLRDPVQPPPTGIEDRRLRVYRQLFIDSIESLLSPGFPVIRATLGDRAWKALVRRFFATHRSCTPLFTEIAAEFVAFVEDHAQVAGLPPWLPELAHYEWVEQALFISDEQAAPHDPNGDLLDGVPLLSPLALPLAYRWPVTDIAPGRVPEALPAEPTLLLVHRGADQQVHFARITPLAYRVLTALRASTSTGREHLAALAAEAGVDAGAIQSQGLLLLQQLHTQGVVLGTAVPN